MADSVINCNNSFDAIKQSFTQLYSKEFNQKLIHCRNPYGDGGASKKIKDILKTIDLKNILKKSFYDIKVECEKL